MCKEGLLSEEGCDRIRDKILEIFKTFDKFDVVMTWAEVYQNLVKVMTPERRMEVIKSIALQSKLSESLKF